MLYFLWSLLSFGVDPLIWHALIIQRHVHVHVHVPVFIKLTNTDHSWTVRLLSLTLLSICYIRNLIRNFTSGKLAMKALFTRSHRVVYKLVLVGAVAVRVGQSGCSVWWGEDQVVVDSWWCMSLVITVPSVLYGLSKILSHAVMLSHSSGDMCIKLALTLLISQLLC